MNNILNIYNIELKRVYKWFLGLLAFLIVGNIGLVSSTINNIIKDVAERTKVKPSVNLMKLQEFKTLLYEHGSREMYYSVMMLFGLMIIFCLIYALVIWYRDFYSKNKTGYTLFMLPQNKFNIYIAKALTVITMIYITTLTQILLFFIEFNIVKSLASLSNNDMNYLFKYTMDSSLNLIQPYFMDFIMINVIGVILAVVVIFTGVMIHKSFKLLGLVLGGGYILGSMYLFGYLVRFADYQDQILMVHGIYYVVLFLTSISLSYVLLNKKVYV
ncbi:MAG: hypothetical protein ACRC3Y_12565 [Romboutsia sp.]|uniref:hypothetical protein n=1 Tax=Romboutsia sp. TaxID=1965302 RepID=UPI003F36B17D